MADPITVLTASAIANLAFQEFIKSGAGELALSDQQMKHGCSTRKTLLSERFEAYAN
ncbi:MAG: hypothetical protein ACKPJT_09905 [Microcystis panniformis]